MMKRIHLIGIGGTGLSAIALVLAQQGYQVSGSDRALSPLARNLQAAGIQVSIGHRRENVAGADLVVRSSAIPDDNPEVQSAHAAGIPVLKRAEFLETLIGEQLCIAVAGTHGKTTTTAMLAWMLTRLELDPSFIVGGVIQNLDLNAHAGKGPDFVIEADEYDRMFLGLRPTYAVVTHLEHDHPDCFPTPEDYFEAFLGFSGRIVPGGTLLVCRDNPGTVTLAKAVTRQDIHVLTYGTSPEADYRAENIALNAGGDPVFQVFRGSENQPIAAVSLKTPGTHNALNALAALAVADRMGLPLDKAADALGEYLGSGRRFEVRGEASGVTIIDDYAHHPTEIRATLAAARARYAGRRIWAVWQPHTYSRTRALFNDFASAFSDADRVIITEVYAAREPAEPFSSAEIVAAMDLPTVHFSPTLNEAAAFLLDALRPGDVVIVLSAGDADQISAGVLEALRERTGA